MTLKMPNLSGVKDAVRKMVDEIEEDSRKFIEVDIPAVLAHKNATFENARTTILDGAKQNVSEVRQFIDDFAKELEGHNGGPTLDGSSEPSGQQK